MPKQSQIEKAVEKLDREIAVLQEVRGRLVEQMQAAPKRKRAKKTADGPSNAQ